MNTQELKDFLYTAFCRTDRTSADLTPAVFDYAFMANGSSLEPVKESADAIVLDCRISHQRGNEEYMPPERHGKLAKAAIKVAQKIKEWPGMRNAKVYLVLRGDPLVDFTPAQNGYIEQVHHTDTAEGLIGRIHHDKKTKPFCTTVPGELTVSNFEITEEAAKNLRAQRTGKHAKEAGGAGGAERFQRERTHKPTGGERPNRAPSGRF